MQIPCTLIKRKVYRNVWDVSTLFFCHFLLENESSENQLARREVETDERVWQTFYNTEPFFSPVASRSQLLPTKKEPTSNSWRNARKTRLVSPDLPSGLFLAWERAFLLRYFRFRRQIYSATKGSNTVVEWSLVSTWSAARGLRSPSVSTFTTIATNND